MNGRNKMNSRFLSSLCLVITTAAFCTCSTRAESTADPLPSWNDGPAKQAIVEFVKSTTTEGGAKFVAPAERVATFDEDGTTWVEHPMYTEVVFSLDRVAELAPQHPEWKDVAPFNVIIARDKEAMEKLTLQDLMKIVVVTHTGISPEEFEKVVDDWLAKARDPRWHRPYTELAYQPMLEVMRYLRANGYKTYIVTGGTEPFVRAFAAKTYGIPPEQIIGTTVTTSFDPKKHQNDLTLDAKMLLNNNYAGKAEDIYLFTGRRPQIAFGNTGGDQQMLEYTTAGDGARLGLLVLHDDKEREYAYGPADGLPDTKVGAFSQVLFDEAKSKGWTVIRMKSDWKQVFSFRD
jgi:phosphoglycolate phosphatase-like HAD superfamily hydrolase